MDPEATLKRTKECLRDGDTEGAGDALNDYFAWRLKGGFQPKNGDRIARKCLIDLGIFRKKMEEIREKYKPNPIQKDINFKKRFFLYAPPEQGGFEYGWDGRTPIIVKVTYAVNPPKRAKYYWGLPSRMVNTPHFQEWYKTSNREIFGTKKEILERLEHISAHGSLKQNPKRTIRKPVTKTRLRSGRLTLADVKRQFKPLGLIIEKSGDPEMIEYYVSFTPDTAKRHKTTVKDSIRYTGSLKSAYTTGLKMAAHKLTPAHSKVYGVYDKASGARYLTTRTLTAAKREGARIANAKNRPVTIASFFKR